MRGLFAERKGINCSGHANLAARRRWLKYLDLQTNQLTLQLKEIKFSKLHFVICSEKLSIRGCVNPTSWLPAHVSSNLLERNMHFRVLRASPHLKVRLNTCPGRVGRPLESCFGRQIAVQIGALFHFNCRRARRLCIQWLSEGGRQDCGLRSAIRKRFASMANDNQSSWMDEPKAFWQNENPKCNAMISRVIFAATIVVLRRTHRTGFIHLPVKIKDLRGTCDGIRICPWARLESRRTMYLRSAEIFPQIFSHVQTVLYV